MSTNGAERADRIRHLVVAAAGLEAGEREEVLRRHGGDAELVAEARRRLALADAAPADFLSGRATGSASGDGDGDETLAEQGLFDGWERYEVGELLGAGAVGEVYRAWDPRLKRHVALKFLRHADDATTRRFLREAEAQARVEHERVQAVYEIGEHAHRPYLALQYVDGRPLMAARDETTVEQKAQLMAAVAEGLHAAHREGLVHRDVKPANILVGRAEDGRLEPYVTDFGLARPVAAPELTTAGTLLGTPHYMAPEQLRSPSAGLDRRADVWGFGATLFHFLTGEVPFPCATSLETFRRVLRQEAPPLRRRDPGLPVDLEAVVGKCLEKDPARRYPSCRAVAEDLRRFLDGEPVRARTATPADRLAKWLLRHRAAVLAAAAMLALVVAMLAAFAVHSGGQTRAIAVEAARAQREAARAHRETVTARLVSGFLIELFGTSDLGQGRGNTVTAREVLDRGAERVERELGDQPLVQAQLMDTLGVVYLDLGLYEPAAYMLERGLEIARRQLGDDGTDLAELMDDLTGRFGRRDGQRWPLYAHALGLDAPAAGGDLVASLEHLAALYADRGDLSRAESLGRRALELREGALGTRHPDVARCRARLGAFVADRGELGEAEELYRRAIADLEAALGPGDPTAAREQWRLGSLLAARGRRAEAARWLSLAAMNLSGIVARSGEEAGLQAEIARLDLAAGRPELARRRAAAASAAAARHAAVDAGHTGAWRLADALLAEGEALAAVGEEVEAARRWRAGLEALAPLTRDDGGVLGRDLLARLLLRLGDGEAARPLVEGLLADGWRRPPLADVALQAGLAVGPAAGLGGGVDPAAVAAAR